MRGGAIPRQMSLARSRAEAMQARECMTVTNTQLVSALAPASGLYLPGTGGGDVETKESREASLEAATSFNQKV